MKILNLQAENIKRLKAVDITPHENVVVIAGKNGEGKSSVLDSIYWALAGGKNIQDKPIRDGEEKASVRLDLGKFIVERRFTQKGNYLEVRSQDGATFKSPQDLLNTMTAAITFDPLDFSRMEPKAQYETLRRLVKIDLDIDALDAANQADFDKRTEIGRQVKSTLAEWEGLKKRLPELLHEEVPSKVDVVAVANEMNALKDKQREKKTLADRIKNGHDTIAAKKFALENLRKDEEARRKKFDQDFADTEKKIEMDRDFLKQLTEQDAAMPSVDPAAISDLEKKIAHANQTNALVDLINATEEKRMAHEALVRAHDDLTAVIEKRRGERVAAIAAAKMPIAGLGLADNGVTFNGIPFDQASSAEQIKVSTAIAMAMNPELRVIRIKDGALLDDDSMKILREMAAEKDFQIWIERVGGDQVGIIIEDGSVKDA